jgi:glycosyltransferase involved in cell wall biosynthesis
MGHTTKTPCSAIRFGFIGALAEHKGAHLLIDAFRRMPPQSRPVTLSIWGDPSKHGNYGQGLIRQAVNCPAIRFCGTFPNHRIGEIFDEIDLLVVPSLWYENAPLVLYSALATRTPVIATDLGGISEVIQSGVNGFLFPVGDVRALTDTLVRCVREPDLVERLRANIGPVKTTADNVVELENLYQQLTARPMLPVAA